MNKPPTTRIADVVLARTVGMATFEKSLLVGWTKDEEVVPLVVVPLMALARATKFVKSFSDGGLMAKTIP